MKESVLFSACIVTQAAILVLGTGLMKLDVCIMRQGSPRIKNTAAMILLGHVTTDNFGNQKPQHPPSLLKIHQLI